MKRNQNSQLAGCSPNRRINWSCVNFTKVSYCSEMETSKIKVNPDGETKGLFFFCSGGERVVAVPVKTFQVVNDIDSRVQAVNDSQLLDQFLTQHIKKSLITARFTEICEGFMRCFGNEQK